MMSIYFGLLVDIASHDVSLSSFPCFNVGISVDRMMPMTAEPPKESLKDAVEPEPPKPMLLDFDDEDVMGGLGAMDLDGEPLAEDDEQIAPQSGEVPVKEEKEEADGALKPEEKLPDTNKGDTDPRPSHPVALGVEASAAQAALAGVAQQQLPSAPFSDGLQTPGDDDDRGGARACLACADPSKKLYKNSRFCGSCKKDAEACQRQAKDLGQLDLYNEAKKSDENFRFLIREFQRNSKARGRGRPRDTFDFAKFQTELFKEEME